jgi:hypothetical protein
MKDTLRSISGALVMRAKAHAWWIVPIVGGVASVFWIWVGTVNATVDTVIKHDVILPEIRDQLQQINNKQDKANDDIVKLREDVSNIKGRLRR